MSKAKWFLEKLANVVFDVIAGIFLFLILGGYISQALSEIFPQLPTILGVSLTLAIVIGLVYRSFQSIRFHRFVERMHHDLVVFLEKWDELNSAFLETLRSHDQEARKRFEETRTTLQYDYPKISSAITIRYAYKDNIQGIMIRDYDVIGNLILKSPFTRMDRYMTGFAERQFEEQWDAGRGTLVSTIGHFDRYRRNAVHWMYMFLHLVPIPTSQEDALEGTD